MIYIKIEFNELNLSIHNKKYIQLANNSFLCAVSFFLYLTSKTVLAVTFTKLISQYTLVVVFNFCKNWRKQKSIPTSRNNLHYSKLFNCKRSSIISKFSHMTSVEYLRFLCFPLEN